LLFNVPVTEQVGAGVGSDFFSEHCREVKTTKIVAIPYEKFNNLRFIVLRF
jgi:hypothetical protein